MENNYQISLFMGGETINGTLSELTSVITNKHGRGLMGPIGTNGIWN